MNVQATEIEAIDRSSGKQKKPGISNAGPGYAQHTTQHRSAKFTSNTFQQRLSGLHTGVLIQLVAFVFNANEA